MKALALVALWAASGCAAVTPLPVHDDRYALALAERASDSIFAAARAAYVLAPRLGDPIFTTSGQQWELTLMLHDLVALPPHFTVTLERGARKVPVELVRSSAPEPLPSGRNVVVRWVVRAPAEPGGYDLVVQSEVDAPARLPRSVWIFATPPTTARALRVIQLSDLHIGRSEPVTSEHLTNTIAAVNALHPDLVLVTGDLAHMGDAPGLEARAAALLLHVEAPLVIIPGNHDHGFNRLYRQAYGPGWQMFAHTFHPALTVQFSFGGYNFVGFDSGPSTVSPAVQTRGLSDASVADFARRAEEARRAGALGAIFFSHAPTRAVVTAGKRGPFGHMRRGGPALERVLITLANEGQLALHLAGHTHWADLYELDGDRFTRRALTVNCPRALTEAALITTQSASESGISAHGTGDGYGFVGSICRARVIRPTSCFTVWEKSRARGSAASRSEDRAVITDRLPR